MKHGKKYREAIGKYEKLEFYPVDRGVELVKDLSYAKFDESIEVSVKLKLKKSQTVRDTLVLPHQFTEGKKILVFAKGDKAEEAKEAGADYVGDADLVEKIQGGWLDFDVAVATPDMMKDVGRLGPILGRRGLMPNPKTQTVTFDIKAALAELQRGRTEFRSDKTNIIHCAVGRVSMDKENIVENLRLLLNEVNRKRPADAKGGFIESVAISSTMGPGVRLDLKDVVDKKKVKVRKMAEYTTKLQQHKVDAIGELKENFQLADNFIFADYRGLNVEQITALRNKLRENGAVFKVIKNRFAKIAMKELELPEVSEQLVGPTAFALIKDEAGAAAKVLVEFTGDTSLKLKGGIIDGQVFDGEQVTQFSRLPSKSELIAMLMSAMNGPVQGFLYALQAVPQKLVRTLQAVVDKKAAEEG